MKYITEHHLAHLLEMNKKILHTKNTVMWPDYMILQKLAGEK